MEINYNDEPKRYVVPGNTMNTHEGIKNQHDLLHIRQDINNTPRDNKYIDKHVHIGNNNILLNNQTGSNNQTGPNNQNGSNNQSDKYDPYMEYIEKRGVTHDCADDITRSNLSYININSADRSTTPITTSYDDIKLSSNPLFLTNNSQNMVITHAQHGYNINDKITLSGITKPEITVRSDVNGIHMVELIVGKSYAVIHLSHGIHILNSAYDTSDMYIQINDFLGNINNATYFDNIIINSINDKHNISILNPDDQTFDENKFYIILSTPYNGTLINYDSHNFTLMFFYIAGIPTNIMNTNYPIGGDNLQGFHIITEITENTYTVKLSKTSGNTIHTGGDFVIVNKLKEVSAIYPNPNNYRIEFGKTFHNVVGVKMISSEFPNMQNINMLSINEQNNKIYWKNYDDATYIYNIIIPSGNYSLSELVNIMESLFFNTPRINYDEDVLLNKILLYTNHNIINVIINESNNIVTFKSYKQSNIIKPFIDVTPLIDIDSNQDPTVPVTNYKLTINHKNHGLLASDNIIISGAIEHMGIPEIILNNTHVINEIISADTYTIQLLPFNLNNERVNTYGGAAVTIISPNLIKLYFNELDTIGSILGFRNVGETLSVTSYGNSISNSDPYPNDVYYDAVGNSITLTNNNIGFNRNNYIQICCPQLNNIHSTGPINNMFAKILLSKTENILFDTFVKTPTIYFDTINELCALDLSFYLPNGDLVDFNYMNHSFTLEITTINEHPKDTQINIKTGKINYG